MSPPPSSNVWFQTNDRRAFQSWLVLESVSKGFMKSRSEETAFFRLFPVCHYDRCSIHTCHQKVHTNPDATTLNSFVQHAIPSPFCLVLTVWQLLHVGPGRKNVHVAFSVTGICGGCVDRYWLTSSSVSHSLFSLDSLSSLTLAAEDPAAAAGREDDESPVLVAAHGVVERGFDHGSRG